MESLTVMSLTTLPPIQKHYFKITLNTTFLLQSHLSFLRSSYHFNENNLNTKKPFTLKTAYAHHSNPVINNLTSLKSTSLALVTLFSGQYPSFANEMISPSTEVSSKINVEAMLISIDDFFNRNPFFVAGVTFIWLVVIPLTEEYLKKYKFISTLDAFRKLKNDSNAQLLDIRNKKSLVYLGTPNLKLLKKSGFQVQFVEGDEEGFVKKVVEIFKDPGSTTVCILDNFDGNSMVVAELLFKNGFKECYAIKGGIRGKDGWQEIQETFLPPSMHILSKNSKLLNQLETEKTDTTKQAEEKIQGLSSSESASIGSSNKNGYVSSTELSLQANLSSSRPSSPYPKYSDLKPPSSPTPSKPLD